MILSGRVSLVTGKITGLVVSTFLSMSMLMLASFVASVGVTSDAAAMEAEESSELQACRLVFGKPDVSGAVRRAPICIRNISAESCEDLESTQAIVAAGIVSSQFSVLVTSSCAVDDCVLDVVRPSDAAHCQGISLTPTRVKVDKTTTSGPVSASF